VRFLKNTIKREPGEGEGPGAEPSQDQLYENMQVSAIVMLNQETGDSSKRWAGTSFSFLKRVEEADKYKGLFTSFSPEQILVNFLII